MKDGVILLEGKCRLTIRGMSRLPEEPGDDSGGKPLL